MRAVTPGTGILLRTSWVHGRGLPGPIGLVRIDRDGVATATAVLPAGGHRRFPGRGWVLELPAGTPLPPVGATLSAGPIFAGCPAA